MSDRSPKIVALSWGHIDVEGVGTGKDFKLYPGGGREWDWSETGTRHSPGIQLADVEELLDHGATAVVLSQGIDSRLQVAPMVVRALEVGGVTVHIAQTQAAVALYNQLTDGGAVGGLFHSTC